MNLRYREALGPGVRAWALFAFALFITVTVVSPRLAPVTIAAWIVNVVRFASVEIRIDEEFVWVGRRKAPLRAFDLSTLDRASNSWPWQTLDPNWLGANPVWTRDSIGLDGSIDGRRVRLRVGTDHREFLLEVLQRAVTDAQTTPVVAAELLSHRPSAPPGWYPDPWNPVASLRWWDGHAWSAFLHDHPRTSGR